MSCGQHPANRRSFRMLLPLVVAASSGTALGKPATVALTTTVGAEATAAERALMADLLALVEVSVSSQPGVEVVERMELDAALHELVLSRALGPNEKALQLAKLATAELILTARLLEPRSDGKWNILVRVTESLTGRIRGAMVAPVERVSVAEAAQEITGYLSAVVAAPESAGISVAVAPFESLGRFDRLRPLERGLRDMIVARLLQYRRFHVLQRSEMRQLLDEIDLVRSGLSDATQLPETLPSRRATYLIRGTVDERHDDGALRVLTAAHVVRADTRHVVESLEWESTLEDLPRDLASHIHRLVRTISADAGRDQRNLSPAPDFDEVEHLFRSAVRDLYRFWRRKPRDFSFRDFRLPGVHVPGLNRNGRIPIDSALGTALLHKSVDRLESVLYLQPNRTDAAYALAFCFCCHLDGLWQPERADMLLRNVIGHDPAGPLAVEALNLLAEMYYHHYTGTLKREDEEAALERLLFAFQEMPDTHRDYEWSRLVELAMRLGTGRKDHQFTADLMQLVAGLAEKPSIGPRRQLASYAAGMAQSLSIIAGENPELQDQARQLLERWSESGEKWPQYFALQALARLAERENNSAEAAELYREAGRVVEQRGGGHDHHLMEIRRARSLRESGDPEAALALLRSFRPQNRGPTSLLNGYYGVELGATLEALGRKQEALETYVSYAEASAHLVDNSDVDDRITALGGVPLRTDRDIEIRYIDSSDGRPFHCRSLATDGRNLYVGGDYRAPWNNGVMGFNLATKQWTPMGGPQARASCLACNAGYLWIGTDDQGLWRCHLATNTWKNWRLADGLPDDNVVDIATHGAVALVSVGGRNSGGVVRVGADDEIHVYESRNAPGVALQDLTIHAGQLYGVNAELYRLDLNKGAWNHGVPGIDQWKSGLNSVLATSSGLWGSAYGREIFPLRAAPPENALYKPSWFPRGLGKAGYHVHFAIERDGQLWFGGSPWWRFKSAGFYRLDLETGDFVIYGPRDGFRLSVTYECYDGLAAADRLWLATSAGLAEVTIRQ